MAIQLLNDERRILSVEDVNELKVFDKIGLESSYTDFAYALGGELVIDTDQSRDYKSIYQLKTNDSKLRYMVSGDKVKSYYSNNLRGKGARIVTNIPFNKEGDIQVDSNGVPFVYYGVYPQTVASRDATFLIKATKYVVDVYAIPRKYSIDTLKAYGLNDKRYVLVDIADLEAERTVLSNGSEICNGDSVAFEVEPIKWFLDEETGILISEKILSYGIDYNIMNNHKGNVKRLTPKNKN